MSETQCKIYGMDYLYALSVAAVRKSEYSSDVKEGLKYSLNCFYRLYGGQDENFSPDAVKCGLYELVYRIVCLKAATTELKAMWYIYFPYVILAGAPHDEGIYAALKDELCRNEIYDAVLKSKYCEMVFDSDDEARSEGIDPLVIDWYEPFNAYKFTEIDGEMRIVSALKRELVLRNFDYTARFAERLLRLFPSSGTLILMYSAAVTGSLEGKSAQERVTIVTDLMEFIEAVKWNHQIQPELCYYRGLCLIALRRIDEAEESFRTCLELKPGYEPAELMIRAIRRFDS